MAFGIEKETEYGLAAGYWAVKEIHAYALEGQVTAVVYGWLDRASRAADPAPSPLRRITISLDGEGLFEADGSVAPAAVYEALRALPDWAAAIAV